MPTYLYRCKHCEIIFEETHSMAVAGEITFHCRFCNSPLERVYTHINQIFKGSGFYCTDNPKGGE